ncbi:MAG: Tfp pilus assembly protein PilF [Pseudohongiellaceae bacterium]|jgi:Tfp pilus assembly protein PilF
MHTAEPNDSAVLEKLVAVSVDTGRIGDARKELAQALQRDPSRYRSWRSLAMVEEAAGELTAARSAAERCLNLHPTWVTSTGTACPRSL